MSRNVVDIAIIELNGKELQTVRSYSPNRSAEGKESVMVMRRSRKPIGFKRGTMKTTYTLQVVQTSPPEIDWHKMLTDHEEFLLVYEENDGGTRYRLVDSQILSIGSSYEAEGETVYDVECEALDHQKEG